MGKTEQNQTQLLKTFLELLDQPIAFHPWYAKLTGSALAALFLSFVLDKTHDLMRSEFDAPFAKPMPTHDPETLWVTAKIEEVEQKLYMSRTEQQTARKHLLELGFLEEKTEGLPAQKLYRANVPRILNILGKHIAAPNSQLG